LCVGCEDTLPLHKCPSSFRGSICSEFFPEFSPRPFKTLSYIYSARMHIIQFLVTE